MKRIKNSCQGGIAQRPIGKSVPIYLICFVPFSNIPLFHISLYWRIISGGSNWRNSPAAKELKMTNHEANPTKYQKTSLTALP